MSVQPLVTVLIPAYNAASTIRRAVDSAIKQDYRPLEIVVVNDASQDDTAAIVQTYNEEYIRLFSLEKNLGECGAMNFGLQKAKGELIAFLDADDEWLDGKITKQVALISANPSMAFVTCGCLFVSDFGHAPYQFGLELASVDSNEVWRRLLAATSIAKPCVLARRASLEKVGPFDAALAVAGDQDMWIRLAVAGQVGLVPELLVKAHDTPNSLTKKYVTRMADFVLPMVRRHVENQRQRLAPNEIRQIWGERYTTIGRNLYSKGSVLRGLAYLLCAIGRHHRIPENVWYIITAAPPSRWLKAVIFGREI